MSLINRPLGAPQELTWKQKTLICLWYLGSDSSYRWVNSAICQSKILTNYVHHMSGFSCTAPALGIQSCCPGPARIPAAVKFVCPASPGAHLLLPSPECYISRPTRIFPRRESRILAVMQETIVVPSNCATTCSQPISDSRPSWDLWCVLRPYQKLKKPQNPMWTYQPTSQSFA